MGSKGTVADPTSIDAAWMTQALEEAGVARGATVTRVEFVGFIGTGQMGRNARYALTWDDPAGRPSSVVGKFPTDDPPTRTNSFEGGSYLRECDFYSTLKATVDVCTPTVWIVRYDQDAQEFVILMEDMRHSAQGDQFRGLTFDEARLAVTQAAGLHAPRWGDPTLTAVFPDDPSERADRLSELYAMLLEPALARITEYIDDVVADFARRFTPHVHAWTMGTDAPRTIAHMDFRPDNFLFAAGPEAPPLAIVDWQTYTLGPGAHDLAYMIGGGFEPEVRRTVERELVEAYRTELAARGVTYDADLCWRDYCISSLWGVIMSVIALMLAESTERGNRMLATMLRRHAHHAMDVDAIGVLTRTVGA